MTVYDPNKPDCNGKSAMAMSHKGISRPRFALFGKCHRPDEPQAINVLLQFLRERGAEVIIERVFAEFLHGEMGVPMEEYVFFDDANFDADYAVSLGGDGTLLYVASKVGRKPIPIIGINLGRLGFLADVSPIDIIPALSAVLQGECTVENHSLVKVESTGIPIKGAHYALNEVALLKKDNASMITVHASIDKEYMGSYQADGLIIATPTGSTAYSLSNGGSIILPQTNTLCLTPVAPHSLNIRPLVIPDTCVLELKVESRTHNFLVAVDGRSQTMCDSTAIRITKAEHSIQILRNPHHHYFATLREKLLWGVDLRKHLG